MTPGKRVALGLGLAFLASQLIVLERTNPKGTGELRAPPGVMSALRRACYDCHSNETLWPWYSRIAPASWLVSRHVRAGRSKVNFSNWESLTPEQQRKKRGEVGEEVEDGEMPPWYFTPVHPGAALTSADRDALRAWAGGAGESAGAGRDDDR